MDYRGVAEDEFAEDTRCPVLLFTVGVFRSYIYRSFLESEAQYQSEFMEFADSCPTGHLIAMIGNSVSYVDPMDIGGDL